MVLFVLFTWPNRTSQTELHPPQLFIYLRFSRNMFWKSIRTLLIIIHRSIDFMRCCCCRCYLFSPLFSTMFGSAYVLTYVIYCSVMWGIIEMMPSVLQLRKTKITTARTTDNTMNTQNHFKKLFMFYKM